MSIDKATKSTVLWEKREIVKDLKTLFSTPSDQLTNDQIEARFTAQLAVSAASLKEGFEILESDELSTAEKKAHLNVLIKELDTLMDMTVKGVTFLQSKGIEGSGKPEDLQQLEQLRVILPALALMTSMEGE
ncbi:hypothetical protein D3C85_806010 [compost metagenome]